MSNEKDLMGYDPLEWLKGESADDTAATPATPAPAAAAEPPVTAEPPQEVVAADDAAPIEQAAAPATIDEKSAPDSDVLDLQGSLQIMDVALLKPRFEEILGHRREITLRAEPDITVDGAGMQLLLAFVQQAQADGVRLSWETLPPAIVEAARLLDMKQVTLAE